MCGASRIKIGELVWELKICLKMYPEFQNIIVCDSLFLWNHVSQLYVQTEWEVGETSLDLYTDGTGNWNSKEGPITRQTLPPTESKLRDHNHWCLLCLMIFMSSTLPLLLLALTITTQPSPFTPVWASLNFQCCWTAPCPGTGHFQIHPYLFTHCAIQASMDTLLTKERSHSTTALLLWRPPFQCLLQFSPPLHLHSRQPQLRVPPQLHHRA